MPPARPLLFWIATIALVAVAAVLLREVLLPFVAGMALAYLLDPLVNRLEKIGRNRAIATLFVLGLFLLTVITLLTVAVPVIGAEVATLIDSLPSYLTLLQSLAEAPGHPWISKIVDAGMGAAQRSSAELTAMSASWISAFLRALWSDGRAIMSILSLLVVTPIVTAYLVYDWNRIIASLDDCIPAAHRTTVRALAREIDGTISSFLRGQGTICVMLGVFYALALRSVGLKHGVLIGLLSGLLGFVPYLGSLTGLLLSIGVAILQFGLDWEPILIVLGIFLVGQSTADYVLAPVLVGSKVHLNPVWLLFALFSFGYLFGIVGLLIAVPLAASIGVLVRFALRQNRPGRIDSNSAQSRSELDLGATISRPPLQ
jgi:predicted PurR-regulated permease PerM